jgi:hypothetical protein
MAARNYQPTAKRLANLLSNFISRYQSHLIAGMTSSQAVALASLEAALSQFISELTGGGGV